MINVGDFRMIIDSLTLKQRHEMKRAEVARVVAAELEGRLKLVKPVVANATKELESRRGKLTSKGSPLPPSYGRRYSRRCARRPADAGRPERDP